MAGSVAIIGSAEGIESVERERAKAKARKVTDEELGSIRQSDARVAARKIGAALARAGFNLRVYSAKFIESDVVQGYVASGKAKPGSITIPVPAGVGKRPMGGAAEMS